MTKCNLNHTTSISLDQNEKWTQFVKWILVELFAQNVTHILGQECSIKNCVGFTIVCNHRSMS